MCTLYTEFRKKLMLQASAESAQATDCFCCYNSRADCMSLGFTSMSDELLDQRCPKSQLCLLS